MVNGYRCFKCMECGKGFRVLSAGLSGDAFKELKCKCGSDRVVNINNKEYRELVRGKKLFGDGIKKQLISPKSKPLKKKHRGVATKLYGFENHVPLVTEKHEGAKHKTEVKHGKKKRKERQSDNSGRGRRLVVTR